MRKFKTGGQSLSELALCLAVISAAIVGMQLYLQRSLQAHYRQAALYPHGEIIKEKIRQGAGFDYIFGYKWQYDPYYRQSNIVEIAGDKDAAGNPVFNRQEKLINGTIEIDTFTQRSGWVITGPVQEAD